MIWCLGLGRKSSQAVWLWRKLISPSFFRRLRTIYICWIVRRSELKKTKKSNIKEVFPFIFLFTPFLELIFSKSFEYCLIFCVSYFFKLKPKYSYWSPEWPRHLKSHNKLKKVSLQIKNVTTKYRNSHNKVKKP